MDAHHALLHWAAYDESDTIVSSHRSKIIGTNTLDVYGESHAFGHFYFATFC
jgi:hypothetical protein